MPITPFIGVRTSWLIVARNSDFSREAVTASSCARAISASARLRPAISRTKMLRTLASPEPTSDMLNSTGNSCPSRCCAIRSIRRFAIYPSPSFKYDSSTRRRGTTTLSGVWPTTSARDQPKILSAFGFQSRMMLPASTQMTASRAASIIERVRASLLRNASRSRFTSCKALSSRTDCSMTVCSCTSRSCSSAATWDCRSSGSMAPARSLIALKRLRHPKRLSTQRGAVPFSR